MIFIAAGTQDGRELAGLLLESGHEVTASVVSRYGRELLAQYPNIKINDQPLDASALTAYLKENAINLFIDASHPYAANVSRNAMAACRAVAIPYLRYERPSSPVQYEKLIAVHSYEEAAGAAAKCGQTVFLTTGSRNVAKFVNAPALKNHAIVARVLPDGKTIDNLIALGLAPKNIIAMQGPFSRELNREMFRQYKADVIITKNSGTIGGADTKFLAAADLNLPVVLIDKPPLKYDNLADNFAAVLDFAAKIPDIK